MTSHVKLSDCDWLGFDLDHTLARYKLEPINQLIFECLVDYLVSLDEYPEVALRVPYDHDFAARGVILDLERGNLLKLDKDKHVVRGYHGKTQIDPREYPEPITEFHDEPTERFKPMITFFEVPAIFLMALVVELIESKTIDKTYSQAWVDIRAGFNHSFTSFSSNRFFAEVRNSPEKFLYTRYEVAEWLLAVKSSGRRTFLGTNSHFDFAEFTLTYSFGKDWRKLFDVVIVDCQKPKFFRESNGFHAVDEETCEEFSEVVGVDEMEFGKVYCRGNWESLGEFCSRYDHANGHSSSGRTVYFGDHIRSDVLATSQYTDWIPAAIVEELDYHTSERVNSLAPPTVQVDEYIPLEISVAWGSFLTHSEGLAEEIPCATYWNHYIKMHCECAIVIPCVSALLSLDLSTEFVWDKHSTHYYHVV